ncbi:YolD-like family protein [Desmospora activa]|nr:YolD-like family protein [Desmospora activa]
MTLPEHVGALEDARREQKRYEPPLLSEEMLIEMGRLIEQSYHKQEPIAVTIAGKWDPQQQSGIVVRIDPIEQWLVLQNDEERQLIPFRSVIGVEAIRRED